MVKSTSCLNIFLVLLVQLLLVNSVNGQLCTGSLGDPVVNIDFGKGTNPGPPLAPGVTNYGYVSNGCPADGFYTIGTTSVACFSNTWHTVTEDHTPNDESGYMMIVNASNSPGTFYIDTVRGLCGGTTYEFAAWILNIIKASSCGFNSNKPNVTFIIETLAGANLLTYQSGDVPTENSPLWKQYGAFFTTTPGTTSVVIKMRNNAPGGCGNDLLLDDITFRPCGPQVTSNFNGVQSPREVCIGDNSPITLSATVSQTDALTVYQWQVSTNVGTTWTDVPGANAPGYTVNGLATVAGTTLFRLAVAQGSNLNVASCRVVSNVLTVNVNPLPIPAATNNGPRCEGDSITLTASSGGTYAWTGPNGFTNNSQLAQIIPVQTNSAGKYYVRVTTAAGCTNIDSTVVIVNARVTANAGPDVSICQGNSTVLTGGTGVSYRWSPTAGLSAANVPVITATPVDSTLYILTVSNGECTASDSVWVYVLKSPIADAGPDVKLFQGQSAILNANTSGGSVALSWSPALYMNNPATLRPIVSPPDDITYTLNVTSNNGCGSASDAVFVRVFKSIKIPNVFTPNGDGINDTWKIEALETYPEADLQVFNRQGQAVFTAKGTSAPWDGTYKGKALPVGVYYYVVDVKNEMEKLSGSVTLLR